MERHIEHLKNTIVDVSEKTTLGLGKREDDLRKATLENKTLIKELTELRAMKQKLGDELKNVTKIAENIRRQIGLIKTQPLRADSPFRSRLSKK
jgi:hypothetical protein